MIIQVTPHTITITKTKDINAGEYNITTCTFEFSEEFNDLTNMAVFSTCGNSYKTPILNNQCVIPYEVLEEPGNVLLGVYGYEGEEDLTLRYSPTPQYFNVDYGSYREAGDPELPPKSEWEQVLEIINQAITETNNLNISVDKENGVTTVTLTKKDGTQETVQIEDGKSLEFNWEGTSLGVRVEGQSEYQYVNLQGAKGEPGAIKMQIVNVLPETGAEDTIYLVPIEEPETGNNYDEYIYTNGQWEKLGGIQVEVDLTDYVKFTDYATSSKAGVVKAMNGFKVSATTGNPYAEELTYANYQQYGGGSFVGKTTLENVITGKGLVSNTNYATSSTGGVIKTETGLGTYLNANGTIQASTRTYSQYNGANNELFIGKGTLENVIAGKNLETANNKVTSISASSTDTQYPTAKCMYDLVGNVESLLEVLDIGSGAVEVE